MEKQHELKLFAKEINAEALAESVIDDIRLKLEEDKALVEDVEKIRLSLNPMFRNILEKSDEVKNIVKEKFNIETYLQLSAFTPLSHVPYIFADLEYKNK